MIQLTGADLAALSAALLEMGEIERRTGVQFSGYGDERLTTPSGNVVSYRRREVAAPGEPGTTAPRVEYYLEILEG